MQEFELKEDLQKSLLSDNLVLFFLFKEIFLPPSADNPLGSLDLRSIFYELKALFVLKWK